MKFKRNIYIAILAIAVYFILSFCYEKFILKDDFQYVYILNKDVSRGDIVLESDLSKIKISGDYENKYLTYTLDKYYTDNYLKGTTLLEKMVVSSEEYIRTSKDTEIISIKLNLAEDAGSYQISKGSIVNIFYSAKLAEVSDIVNSIGKTMINSNNSGNGYITLKLLEEVKIINCYDKFGKVVESSNGIDTILIEVSKDESIKINNLKNYGKFSISIIK